MPTIEALTSQIEEALSGQPILDVHTHLDATHLAARGLHDLLLYHMVVSDLMHRLSKVLFELRSTIGLKNADLAKVLPDGFQRGLSVLSGQTWPHHHRRFFGEGVNRSKGIHLAQVHRIHLHHISPLFPPLGRLPIAGPAVLA